MALSLSCRPAFSGLAHCAWLPPPLTRRHHAPSERLVHDALALAFDRHVHPTWMARTCSSGSGLGVMDHRLRQTTTLVDAPTSARPALASALGSWSPRSLRYRVTYFILHRPALLLFIALDS